MFFRKFGPLVAAAFAVVASRMPAGAVSYKAIWNPQLQTSGGPEGRLLLKSGSLFGTSFGYPGDGIVFELTPSGGTWKAKKIFGFNDTNGSGPAGGLLQDSSGALYGTTYNGGADGYGVVFKLTLSSGVWKESLLYSFSGGGSDGANPRCDLVRVPSNGALFGTTQYGGEGDNGTVFSLTYSGGAWSEHVLTSLGGQSFSGVHRDSSGALYGTTFYGGAYNGGVVYKLVKSGSTWKQTTLHNFGAFGDGSFPAGPLIADSNGVLYGTTTGGGQYGGGTVFKITTAGIETVLLSFDDEAYPMGGLRMDSAGAFYGTTNGASLNDGSVFKLSQSGGTWSETVLHNFSGSDGAVPFAGVIEDSAGNLYGTTTMGGPYGWGTAFEITP